MTMLTANWNTYENAYNRAAKISPMRNTGQVVGYSGDAAVLWCKGQLCLVPLRQLYGVAEVKPNHGPPAFDVDSRAVG